MSKFFIRRPIFAIVVSLIIVLLGLISLVSLPIAQYPQISPPTINLSASYTGANAETVNQTVAQVLENQLNGIEGMDYMSSTSSNNGSYSLSIVFNLDTDGNTDSVNVQNTANLAKNGLPSEVQQTGLSVRKSSGDMALMVNLYSPNNTYDTAFLKNYADIYLLDKLKRVLGVGNVNAFGSTDTEETFFKVGKVNFILDNLIAQGKAAPMIVVMPNGNVAAQIAAQKGGLKPGDPMGRESKEAVVRSKQFEDDLIQNILPYIEKNYRAIPNSQNRAIAGFSRGGGQTLRTAFGNMDKFSYVCAYSSYLTPQEIESSYKYLVDQPERTNKLFKLLWVSVGTEDFLYQQTVEYMNYLKEKKVKFESLVTDGGHTWMNVKNYVATTAPMLFK